MEKKYELLKDDYVEFFSKTLYRIKALKDFSNVKAGELGGYIEKEENLSHKGNCWVFGNAGVCGNARVYDNARVYGDASVYGNTRVHGDAEVYGDAEVSSDDDYALVHGFGSENRATTFFRLKNKGIGVKCGCFYGTLEEFKKKVEETHGENKYAKEYLMIADLMEYKFNSFEEE